MLYESTKLKTPMSVRTIYTVHFYEYDSLFEFEGESHDFWELVYADMGDAMVCRDGIDIPLKQGMAMLHAPGVFHTLKAQSQNGLNLFVLSFDCRAQELHRLCSVPITMGHADKQLLSLILTEARLAFSSALDGSYFKLRRRDDPLFGSEQLIAAYLQSLLIYLFRRLDAPASASEQEDNAPDQAGQEQLSRVISLMQSHLMEPLCVDELCKRSLLSRSKLQRLFHRHTGRSALKYYIELRMDAAKAMMRGRLHSYSEIADTLGFASIHYFSRQFKQVTGITPSEYSASLRALSDKQSC